MKVDKLKFCIYHIISISCDRAHLKCVSHDEMYMEIKGGSWGGLTEKMGTATLGGSGWPWGFWPHCELGHTVFVSVDKFTWFHFSIFSHTSAKAECNLSSLSCVCVDQNKATPLEMAYPLGIPWFQVWIWIHHKKFSLDWYLFLNGSLQITLLQIYF